MAVGQAVELVVGLVRACFGFRAKGLGCKGTIDLWEGFHESRNAQGTHTQSHTSPSLLEYTQGKEGDLDMAVG